MSYKYFLVRLTSLCDEIHTILTNMRDGTMYSLLRKVPKISFSNGLCMYVSLRNHIILGLFFVRCCARNLSNYALVICRWDWFKEKIPLHHVYPPFLDRNSHILISTSKVQYKIYASSNFAFLLAFFHLMCFASCNAFKGKEELTCLVGGCFSKMWKNWVTGPWARLHSSMRVC